jgi:sec-independent protein translocase protein TatA
MFINDILQPTHVLLILVVALLVLGPKQLPEAGRAVGRGIHDFESAITGERPGKQDEVVSSEPAGTTADPTV